jgi:PleD family two-component response regulator
LGVAAALATETTLEKLLQKADGALYEAKHMGRNTVALAGAPKAGAQVA